LPLPPVSPSSAWQSCPLESTLRFRMESFLERVSRIRGVRVLSRDRLNTFAPLRDRRDARNLLHAGSPYAVRFASLLAEAIAQLVVPPTPIKGIITDLDNTLWAGIVGEIGPDAVEWNLDRHAGQHAIYQRFLQSLAEDGVLIAAASKNEPSVVEAAFRRQDLLLDPRSVFPLEVSWQPKSQAVARILAAWNIGPEAVVFLDDSPIEVAEVRAAFPSMDCRVFPAEDPDAFLTLLDQLADLCGKSRRSDEDGLRMESLRAAVPFAPAAQAGSHEEILRGAEAVLRVEPLIPNPDPRALELLNKTNQFNLNGGRMPESAWLAFLQEPDARAWIASYEDKFGRLGKISVLAGRRRNGRFEASVWVMSCRAFSRRIEHALADYVFRTEDCESIALDYTPTDRNSPLREFLEEFASPPLAQPVILTREEFVKRCPQIYLRLE
ncbi:MAG TPA: HAD-IIIC family phosphatase, partial [Bryobacteraceae bacterium]|nr:HAD-IIIC family phosphatase [Bryobacteraceae bacterium]